MPRYIDADALIADVMERYCSDCDKRKGIKRGKWRTIYEIGEAPCRACSVDDMKSEIDDAPTADVVERKKEGEWDMFDLISSAYYGKGMYFKQDDGTVYSRYSCKYMSVDESIREFVSLIDDSDLPDVVERKKGKWVEKIGMLMCSECGDAWGTEQFDEVMSFNYCPNCGAEMDDVKNEEVDTTKMLVNIEKTWITPRETKRRTDDAEVH